eukprot:CAMPEP_0168596600 /NCGR_PEP_ID=MMETSP0420-20121227/10104_1 /TAXON_ID=498008 /ORGANISM="Pessonella sp." /LENGTH=258 /DNA_ID=CAMNT_0008633169 /DNA_START=478 /DNA_END=1251 /DNA_ORIENTATION=+
MHSIGIEHLTIEFQPDPIQFLGHFAAVGLNAIEFSRVYNSDTAIHLTHSHFCTISNIEFQHTENRYKNEFVLEKFALLPHSGHHGIKLDMSADNLLMQLDFKTRMWHDVSFDWYSRMNVLSNSNGIDFAIDMHRSANYLNLVTNVTCGEASRVFSSSGDLNRGPHTSWSTFHNIRASLSTQEIVLPPSTGLKAFRDCNFIGIPTAAQDAMPSSLQGTWIQGDHSGIENLFLYQFNKRFGLIITTLSPTTTTTTTTTST